MIFSGIMDAHNSPNRVRKMSDTHHDSRCMTCCGAYFMILKNRPAIDTTTTCHDSSMDSNRLSTGLQMTDCEVIAEHTELNICKHAI